MKLLPFVLWLIPWVFLGCGSPPTQHTANLMAASSTNPSPTPKPDINIVGTPFLSPKLADAEGKLVGSNTLTVTFDVAITPNSQGAFNHNPKDWGLSIGASSSSPEEYTSSTTPAVTVSSTNIPEGNLTNATTGRVTLTLDMTNSSFPQRVALSFPKSYFNDNRLLIVRPFYRVGGDKDNTITLVPIPNKEDFGAIKTAVPLVGGMALQRTLSLSFQDPAAWEAQAYIPDRSSVVNLASPSTLGGYLLLWWSDTECSQAQKWTFQANPHLRAPNDVVQEECAYIRPRPGLSPPTLGCANDIVTASATPPIANVPPDFPMKKEGCYTLQRFAAGSQKSVAIKGLDPDTWYGAMVYPIDSSDKVGSTPSTVFFGKPSMVELASTAINPNLPQSQDCFVATAASGSSSSVAVHYWRVIRDSWLTPWGLTPFYYAHGPQWAQRLENNPKWKPAINWVLEKTGWLWLQTSQALNTLKKSLGNLWAPEARGDEPDFNHSPLPGTTTVQLWGGVLFPTEHKKEFDSFYKKPKPYRLAASFQWGLDTRLGELSLGPMLQYSQSTGKSQLKDPVGNDTGQRFPISYYSLGLYLMADYRLVWTQHPWLTPRFSVGGGWERFRESLGPNVLPPDENGVSSPYGVTVKKPSFIAKFTLESSFLSWGDWATPEGSGIYNMKDFSLQIFGQYNQEFGKKALRLTGFTAGLGVSMVTQ